MPFFSIVIPAYNRADIIVTTIKSVLDQTFDDLEIIVVDDGSTDDTGKIVKKIEDSRLRYIYQQNQERSASRNRGIAASNGAYICLLDSDDHFLPNHLEVLYEHIKNYKFPVAVFKTMMEYGDKSRPRDFSYAYDGQEPPLKYVWENGSQLISLCFHRQIGLDTPFNEKYYCFEDIEWLMRVVMKHSLYQVKEYTTYYNNRNKIDFSGNYMQTVNNCIACIRELESTKGAVIKPILGSNCFDVKVAETYLGIVINAIGVQKTATGFRFLKKAMHTAITPRLAVKYGYYTFKLLVASL